MLRDLVGEMQRQSGAAAEPDDVDDGIAFGDEELELLVRFRHAAAAAGAGQLADDGAGHAPACADALVVDVLPVVGVAKLHDVRVLAGVDVVAIAGAVECVEHVPCLQIPNQARNVAENGEGRKAPGLSSLIRRREGAP